MLFGGKLLTHESLILRQHIIPTAIAARPHGGGGDAVLGVNDFVLIDCGGMLHDYWSDLTRVRNYLTPRDSSYDSHSYLPRHSLSLRQAYLNDSSRFGMQFEMLKPLPLWFPKTDHTPESLIKPPERC